MCPEEGKQHTVKLPQTGFKRFHQPYRKRGCAGLGKIFASKNTRTLLINTGDVYSSPPSLYPRDVYGEHVVSIIGQQAKARRNVYRGLSYRFSPRAQVYPDARECTGMAFAEHFKAARRTGRFPR